MQLTDLRERVLGQIDWSPTRSTDFIARLDGFINRAYLEIFGRLPFLHEKEVVFFSKGDVVSTGTTTDTFAVNSTDDSVLERTIPAIGALATTTIETDNRHDGRYIELVTPRGDKVVRKIMHVWSATDTLGLFTYTRISLDQPWINDTDTGMTWRIFSPVHYLDRSTVDIRGAQIADQQGYPIQAMTQAEAERYGLFDIYGEAQGIPQRLIKGDRQQIPGPVAAPQVVSVAGAWTGPEPQGTFQFYMTYCHGQRHTRRPTNAARNVNIPLFESAPSPVSSSVTVSGANFVRLTLPNLDHEMGYNIQLSALPLDWSRCGFRKRIYLVRKAVVAGAAINIQTREVPELLLEVDADTPTVDWKGVERPDMFYRMVKSGVYQGFRVYPAPDQEYEWRLRVHYRPDLLENPADAPPLEESFVGAIIERALSFLYLADGKPDLSERAEKKSEMIVKQLIDSQGTIKLGPGKRKPSRIVKEVLPYPLPRRDIGS